MFDILEADIVVFQECKIQRKDLTDDMVLVPGWDVYFSLPKHKKGYSGVAIYTRSATCCPIRAEEGIMGVLCPPSSSVPYRDQPSECQIGGYPQPEQISYSIDDATLDSEGRCVVLEFPAFVLIGTYSPANTDSARDDFRLAYLQALAARVRNLVAAGKNVVLLGDLNVIRNEWDYAGGIEQMRLDGVTINELLSSPSRKLLNELLFDGRVIGPREHGEPALWDLTRLFHPHRTGMYTCWNTKTNARPSNFGTRIDYILCSDGIKNWFDFSNIQEGLMGSDHCPVYATVLETVMLKKDGQETEQNLLDIMNPPGMFEGGERKRDWAAKDLLPQSGRLIPEFDRRRNIKDMFFKARTSTAKPSVPHAATLVPFATQIAASKESESTVAIQATLPVQAMDPTPVVLPLGGMVESSDIRGDGTRSGTTQQIKRSPESSSTRPLKKVKQAAAPKSSKSPALQAGQKTLASFFTTKSTPTAPPTSSTDTNRSHRDVDDATAELTESNAKIPAISSSAPQSHTTRSEMSPVEVRDLATPSLSQPLPISGNSGADAPGERVIDPIVSKESWSKLLTPRVPPTCEHGEPCILLVTKKPGINKGVRTLTLAEFNLQGVPFSFAHGPLAQPARRRRVQNGAVLPLSGAVIGQSRLPVRED